MMKAIIYARVSTAKQELDRQINELKAYAKKNEMELVQVFTDTQSGKSKAATRKASSEMFAFIQSEKIDIVLVSEISRLGRNSFDVQRTVNEIVNVQGIDLYLHQQNMRARDRDGKINFVFKLITDILANLAQLEREQLSNRVKSGLKEARRKGKKLGRPKGAENSEAILLKYPEIQKRLRQKNSLRDIAKLCKTSVNTVQKVKKAMLEK